MRVYRDYDQAQLDAQYNNRAAVPDHARWTERWPRASAEARARLEARLDVPYSTGERHRLDIFPAAGRGAPILAFIHGGYWRAFDKSDFSFVASAYVKAGVGVAVIGYPLAPAATLDEITESVRQAVAWLFHHATAFAGDPARLFVSGHSAGGHLTAMMMSTDWAARGLPTDLVKGGAAISGVYDLEPIRLCYLNREVRLTAEMAARNSPLRLLPKAAGPLILAVGGGETDEFQRQQAAYAEAWRGARLGVEIVPLPHDHHFAILDRFVDPTNPLFQAVKRRILGGIG